MRIKAIIIYLFIVNCIGCLLLLIDKQRARKGKWRVPEKQLHLCELLGGIFCMLPFYYYIRHKNRKASFWIISWLIAIAWTTFIFLITHYL